MAKTLLSWDDDGTLNVVTCDAIIGFQDERRAEITRHPIEDGSTISDHRINQPDALMVEIHHSNSPVEPEQDFEYSALPLNPQKSAFKPSGLFALHSAAGAMVGKILGKSQTQLKPYILQATSDKDRIVELHDALISAFNVGAEISLEQYGRRYENFVLSTVRYERRGEGQGGRGIFNLQLESVRTVSTATTDLPDPSRLHAKPKTSRGKKPGTTREDARDALPQGSLAYELAFGQGGLGDAFSGAIQ